MGRPVVLVSEREEDFVFTAQVAKQCNADLVLISEPQKIVEFESKDGPFQAVFLNASKTDEIQSFAAVTNGKINRDRIHAIISPSDSTVSMAALNCGAIGNFVINRFSNALQDGDNYSRIVRAASLERSFGLKSLIKPTDGIQTIKLTDSLQKGFAANAVAFHLRELRCNERISRTVAGAVDELLMNAVYDAPINAAGDRIYDNTPRKEKIDVSGVEMQIGIEDDLIAITVVDSMGSINMDTTLKHVSQCFDADLNFIRGPEYQGAGLGLSMVVRSGGSLFFVNEPGKRTEVTVFFKQTEKFKDFRNPFQFISTRIYR